MGLEPLRATDNCARPFSAREFFRDCPWLRIPPARQGIILIEPLYPRGGLLGGSGEAVPKVSKLAALAAARKKKENEKADERDPKAVSSSIALLDKLKIGDKPNAEGKRSTGEANDRLGKSARLHLSHTTSTSPHTTREARKYPTKKPKAPPEPSPSLQAEEAPTPVEDIPEPPAALLANPSAFARTIFGHPTVPTLIEPSRVSFSPYILNVAETNPFAGPSPDDIVANAQNSSKGLKKGA